MSSSELITLFGILITVLLSVAAGVGAWAALRVGRNAQTLKNFQNSADSWKERSEAQDAKIQDQESEIGDLKKENGELRNKLAQQQGRIDVLTELVRSAISELASSNASNDVLQRLEAIISRGK
jgi:peptidoglycan hydrolase CwlO-like protein